MDRAIVIILSLLYLTSCYDNFNNEEVSSSSDFTPNITIKELHALLGQNRIMEIHQDLKLWGTVTATDRGKNFYRTFIIEHEGYAIELLEGLHNAHSLHPVG